jgi:hypothetical protein
VMNLNFEEEVFENRRFLFQNIAKTFPTNPWVIKATEKMKGYSKEEYSEMLKEAYEFQNKFDIAIDYGVQLDTEEAHDLFVLFIQHIRWFFEIDKDSYEELMQLCNPNINQFLIVNKSYSDLLFNILTKYRSEVGV